jgi:hypothetical protein
MSLAPLRLLAISKDRPWAGRRVPACFARGAVAATLLILSACSAPAPFVYDSAAYNREDPNFAKPPKNRDSVTVCYSKYGSDQRDVAVLAANACAQFGAGIRFIGNGFNNCPLMTPVGAQFACVGAPKPIQARQPTRSSDTGGAAVQTGAGIAGQPGTPLTGFHDGDRPMGVLFGRPGGTVGGGAPAAMPEAPAPAPAPSGTRN